MKTYNYKPYMRLEGERVIALGLFDGVHIGHRALISHARETASRLGIPLSVFTFISEDESLKGKEKIYSTRRKNEILFSLGVDEIILASFSEIASVSALDFVNSLDALGCRVAVSGADFRFGRGALGDVSLLAEELNSHGSSLLVVDDVTLHGRKVSTSYTKELLSKGRVREAAELLLLPYTQDGLRVVHGRGEGHSFGYPTVNTEAPSILPSGVYLTRVKINGKLYTGMTNIGTCPTFGGLSRHAETHLFDFSSEVYGSEIEISFIDYVREERRFSDESELILQLQKDREFCVNYNLH